MSRTVNESFSVDSMERDENYILGMDMEPDKNDVYRRYLKNLNYTTPKNASMIVHNFAKMLLYNENSTSLSAKNLTKNQIGDDIAPKLLNNKFDVANSEVILVLLTVIYVIIFITGVLGNVVTCIVIARNKGMHTAVNYYLFSLAVSDLLLLISALPDEVYMLWFREYPFDETVCKFHKFAAESFTNATVLTITAFTIERYVAICKPFLSHTMSKLSRAYKFILVIWMISICLAVPQTLFTLHLDEMYLICVPKQDYNHLFVVSTFLLFVIPMSIISILYVLIGLQLRKSKIVQRGTVNGSSVRLKRKIFKKATNQTLVTVTNCDSHYNEALLTHSSDANKNHFIDHESMNGENGRINYSNRGPSHSHGSRHVVNMLVVVVIAFFICWCPFHVQRIVFTYIEHRTIDENLSFSINYISGVLFFTSTCINPFLYNIMSNKFREAFKVTIGSYFSRKTEKDACSNNKLCRNASQRSYSYSVNSTSLNTCSSVCSMQPFNQQQLPFRYFDSDMAKKRPLVVSFRRIQKMTPNNFDNCDSVSICDIHRLDTRMKNNNEEMTMKMMSKCGTNQWRIAMQNSGYCKDSQSCRNFTSNYKRKPELDSLFDENLCSKSHNDKGCVFPKEKFYGNAKLLLTMNDDILRTSIIDCDEDSYGQHVDKLHNSHQNSFSTRHLKKDGKRDKNRFPFNSDKEQKFQTISSTPDDNKMIDESLKGLKGVSMKNDCLKQKDKNRYFESLMITRDKQKSKKRSENETSKEAFGKLNKSSSAPSIFLQTKLSPYSGKTEDVKASFYIPKSVSMVKLRRK